MAARPPAPPAAPLSRGTVASATVAIAAAPAAVLAVLVLSGALAAIPGLAGLAVAGLAALGLALLWASDLAMLSHALRLAARGEAAPATPRLAVHEAVVREAALLARAGAEQAPRVERMLRGEAAMVERLPDPLVVLGRDHAIRRANVAARTAYGADLAAVMRHPVLRQAVARALAPHAAQQDATPGGHGDTSPGTPHVTAQVAPPGAAPRGTDGGAAAHAAAFTPRGTVTAELSLPVPVPREVLATVIVLDPPLAGGGEAVVVLSDRSRERAVERMRADFVANASHELRTPLASLIGFIDTLRGPAADDPPAQTRFLGIMADQAHRMNRLIDDLLSLSRIELTEHQPPSGRVELNDLLRRLADAFEPQMRQRQARLELTLAPGLPPVLGDEDQLEQVLQNLLDNATKYGRHGGAVTLTALRVPPGGRWPARPGVTLAVADDGQGIARAHIPRLTERFYRADKGRSRAVGGTGLGLAIVKHIVNRHRGQLLIESTEGAGTTVTVWLPDGSAALAAAGAAGPA